MNRKTEDDELDKLIGTRTNAIMRKLRSVEALDSKDAGTVLELPEMRLPESDKQEN